MIFTLRGQGSRTAFLAGPLGFEPRQSAPKALDLPLVDGPVKLLATSCELRANSACSQLRAHRSQLPPILPPRQRARDHRARAMSRYRSCFGCRFLARSKQAVNCRPGPRKRSVLGACVFEHTLDLEQFGMLRKA